MRSRRSRRNFFRFITTDSSGHGSLKIPKKFTRQHRKRILWNDVLLIVSDDKVWPLGWMVSGDGKLWLQKGWLEFHDHYCLKFGHLLYFNHLGKSIFHVRIFDPTYREIYASPPTKYLKSGTQENNKATFMEETELLHGPEASKNDDLVSEKGETQRSRNRARKLIKSIKPDNPSYSVTIRSSYLRSSILYVPIRFCRRYLADDRKCVNCVLQMPNGGIWGRVNCRVYKNYAKLCGENWKKFRDQNHLGVGDVCVFELINDTEKVMKVTISHAC